MSEYKTLKKITDNIPNEDSCCISKDMIAISDGAGGCGVFSGEWSEYLVNHIADIPSSNPIRTFKQFDDWIDNIWEPFFKQHELEAKLEHDGMFLEKFYKEGSNATLAVAWQTSNDRCFWLAYGDSVVFHYRVKTGVLEHSFTKITDFEKPPHLICCNGVIEEQGFHSGVFNIKDDSVVFAASDALSHYILMIYYMNHHNDYANEIKELLNSKTHSAFMFSMAKNMEESLSFDILICHLQDISHNQRLFDDFMSELLSRDVLDIDDYTLAILKYDNVSCSIL